MSTELDTPKCDHGVVFDAEAAEKITEALHG